MKFGDKLGYSTVEPTQTEAFVKAWFHPDDIVLIVLIPRDSAGRGTISLTLTARELAEATVENIESLSGFEGRQYQLYFGINPLRPDNQVSRNRRGGKRDVREVYGVWADLDVKPGAFASRDEIHEFLDTLPLEPSIVVENGLEGGIHAYWKMDKPEYPETDLPERWWTYLKKRAGGRDIDRLADSSRIMRLPGALHYPKSLGRTGAVRIIKNTQAVYTRPQIETLTRASYQDYLEYKATVRRSHASRESEVSRHMLEKLRADGDLSWTQRLARVALDERIDQMDWADILEPHGWTHIADGDQGQRTWARPGQTKKSAYTDWNGSGLMSLHSWSEETGLADLKEADVPLTKATVLLRLTYKDDVVRMINELSPLLGLSKGE